MHRRQFLKNAASAALALTIPSMSFRKVHAQSNPLLFLSFEASGAWDPTLLFDPKGADVHSSYYNEEDIFSLSSGLTYAPKSVDAGTPTPYMVGPEATKEDFFAKFENQLVVLRGMDTQTNSHQIGPRHVFSGNIREGNPSFAAMRAAVHEDTIGSALPMSFLSTGGFDKTANLVPPARVGNVDAFKDLSEPYRIYARGTNLTRFFPPSVEDLIKSTQQERAARLATANTTPKVMSAMELLDRARSTEPQFPALLSSINDFPALSAEESTNPIIPKIQLVLAAMAGGQCVSANISYGSFDTHQDHDALHRPRMQTFLDGIEYAHRMLGQLGLLDRTVIIIGSDFSRTTYNDIDPNNDARGKDHWPVTGMMFMGAGIAGGRVIGETDDGQKDDGTYDKGVHARKVKLVSDVIEIAEDDDPEADYIRPPDVIQALREHFGINNHSLSQKYELGDTIFPILPLFS